MSTFDQLISIANDYFATCPKSEYRMIAILYHKSRIYAIGLSEDSHYKRMFHRTIYLPSVHAEISACIKVYNTYVRTHKKSLKADLFIMRNNSLGKGFSSKPCRDCIRLLRSDFPLIHINRVSYFENGKIITEKFSDISNDHVSRGFLKYD